jgi:hypothetical protein
VEIELGKEEKGEMKKRKEKEKEKENGNYVRGPTCFLSAQ